MSCFQTVCREVDDVPKVIRVVLPPRVVEPPDNLSGLRLPSAMDRDERAFESHWFAGFRERWQHALREARWHSRLFALEVE